jgi:hypothetical protein
MSKNQEVAIAMIGAGIVTSLDGSSSFFNHAVGFALYTFLFWLTFKLTDWGNQ